MEAPPVRPGLSGFWDFYLYEHRDSRNRAFHVTGTTLGLLWLVPTILVSPWFLVAGLANGYLFAWIGHFIFEKNRPATFRYPIRSLASDFILWWRTVTGRIGPELRERGWA